MSRLNTKQRRARFRNSKTGKEITKALDEAIDLDGEHRNANRSLVKFASEAYPLYRGTPVI